jgi:hypothetical protein
MALYKRKLNTGSTERAPEPTREEIIAAMRQFISDD